jgi:hypothetical protein
MEELMNRNAAGANPESDQTIAFALTGLGGSNAFGAGFLQAALDCRVEPKIITCTSGMIYWTWRYLEALRAPPASRVGVLRREIHATIRRAEPFPKWADILNTQWLMSAGVPGIFRWALPEYFQRFFTTPLFSLNAQFPASLLDIFLPAQLLVPTRSRSDFEAMATRFNESTTAVCFNSLMPGTGTEFLHINAPAQRLLEPERERLAAVGVDERAHDINDAARWRSLPMTVEAGIDADAIEDAMWLTLYGANGKIEQGGLTNRIDGAYLRSIILNELTMVDTVLMPRPISTHRGELPSNYFESQDYLTELWWNASYAPQVAAIEFVNKLVRNKLLSRGDFREIDLVPVEIDVDRGYFTYFREDLETFDRGYSEAWSSFEKCGLLQRPSIEGSQPAVAATRAAAVH